jgi:single stranded DNA-binding protein (ssb)
MLNTLAITGRLVADPELRTTTQGTSVTSLRIAVQRDYATNGERETDFFEVVVWRGTAEFICKNFRKGNLVTFVGRIQNREWTDKNDQKRVTTEIHAEQAYFGESKPKDGASSNQQYDSGGYYDQQYSSGQPENYNNGVFSPLD